MASHCKQVPSTSSVSLPLESVPETDTNPPAHANKDNNAMQHPLVKAGLISPELVDILIVPSTGKQEKKKTQKAKVLTSEEVLKELEEKERMKKMQEEEKQKRASDRERKKMERIIQQAQSLKL
ncbi:hypothetical protein DPMN_156373 [Dreissena polymorpha]|uniref:Uncharacterized protein n=1 Tax=Dreissena polymorpha TaxID=45954 RepID=A0A9D4FS78_DREPO|nr:hypothetical protein DPMN_156373 [Dreissena polymorpha]